MKKEIVVENVKCGGCARTIRNKIEAITLINDVEVDVDTGKIKFSCQDNSIEEKVVKTLSKWGYPLAGKGTFVENAKSIFSCMIGRIEDTVDNK